MKHTGRAGSWRRKKRTFYFTVTRTIRVVSPLGSRQGRDIHSQTHLRDLVGVFDQAQFRDKAGEVFVFVDDQIVIAWQH